MPPACPSKSGCRSLPFAWPHGAIIALMLSGPAAASSTDVRFVSPSGNISCNINAYVASCSIGSFSPSFTNPPSDCAGDWGNYFYLMANGDAKLGCVSSPVPSTGNVLPYGESIAFPQISCTSRVTGVTCTNVRNKGFALRRSEQQIF
jgi:hypothetical protein